MEPETTAKDPEAEKPPYGVPDLPERNLETYARLWQLETWLRELVYVQLRARDGDAWAGALQRAHKDNDKRLIHMPTPEESLLSYAQLSAVRDVIADNWAMFESYLPPKDIWAAKLAEVMHVRNRVAHFRSTHRDDLARVVQLLRDIDAGMWRFCTAYNEPRPLLPPSGDPVTTALYDLEVFPWTEVPEKKWARLGHAGADDRLVFETEVLAMPWAQRGLPIAGKGGFLYVVTICARGEWHHGYAELLESTRALHEHVVHLRLASDKLFRCTIPAVLGADVVVQLARAFHDAALNALRPGVDVPDERVQRLADTQPEYVLGPSHPLAFITPDMSPWSIFGV